MLSLVNEVVQEADLVGEAPAQVQVNDEELAKEEVVVHSHLEGLLVLHPQGVGIHTYRIGGTLPYTDFYKDVLHLHAPKLQDQHMTPALFKDLGYCLSCKGGHENQSFVHNIDSTFQ